MCTRANWNVFCTRPFIYSANLCRLFTQKKHRPTHRKWTKKQKNLFNRLKFKVQANDMKNKQLFILDLNKLIDLKWNFHVFFLLRKNDIQNYFRIITCRITFRFIHVLQDDFHFFLNGEMKKCCNAMKFETHRQQWLDFNDLDDMSCWQMQSIHRRMWAGSV